MTKNRFALLLLVLLSQTPALAANPSTLPQVPDALKTALLSYARPFLKTVSSGRELHLYSWLDRTQQLDWSDAASGKRMTSDPDSNHESFLDPKSSAIRSYLQMIEHQFYDTSGTGTAMAGDGIYANSDPVGTMSYGGDLPNFALSQFVLVGGTRFLDALSDQSGGGFQSSAAGQALASQITASNVSCYAYSLNDFFAGARNSPGCQALRNVLVDGLGFQIIRYPYPSAAPYANCPNRPQGAFVIFADTPNYNAPDYGVNWDRWLSFTSPLPGNSPNDPQYGNRLLIQGMFELSTNTRYSVNGTWIQEGTPAADGTVDYLPWPGLKGKADTAATQAWMKDHIMGCGSYLEDQIGPVSTTAH